MAPQVVSVVHFSFCVKIITSLLKQVKKQTVFIVTVKQICSVIKNAYSDFFIFFSFTDWMRQKRNSCGHI